LLLTNPQVLAKLKESQQLWEHGLKEANQKLAWGVEDLDTYLHNNIDHPKVTETMKRASKDVIARGKIHLKEKVDTAAILSGNIQCQNI
jgi:hypothetical protein